MLHSQLAFAIPPSLVSSRVLSARGRFPNVNSILNMERFASKGKRGDKLTIILCEGTGPFVQMYIDRQTHNTSCYRQVRVGCGIIGDECGNEQIIGE